MSDGGEIGECKTPSAGWGPLAPLALCSLGALQLRLWLCVACLMAQGKPVLAAVFRVFGAELAEVPLVCTRLAARRQGHCRVFLQALEGMLAGAAVRCLALPAGEACCSPPWLLYLASSPCLVECTSLSGAED